MLLGWSWSREKRSKSRKMRGGKRGTKGRVEKKNQSARTVWADQRGRITKLRGGPKSQTGEKKICGGDSRGSATKI